MTLRHLRILLAVCEQESITKAAQKLYLSQPAVSLAIREMERYYDVRLFDRISHQIFLTDAGRALLRYAQNIVSLFDAMETELKSGEHSGIVRLGCSMGIGIHFMPGYIQGFSAVTPEIRVQVTVNKLEVLERHLLSRELDFAVVEGQAQSEHMTQRSFYQAELAAVCDKGHPLCSKPSVTLEDLAEQDLILLEKGSGTRNLVDSIFSSQGLFPVPLWDSSNIQAVIEAVKAGFGCTMLSHYLIAEELNTGALVRLPMGEGEWKRPFTIIHHKNKYLSKPCRALIELICSQTNGLS